MSDASSKELSIKNLRLKRTLHDVEINITDMLVPTVTEIARGVKTLDSSDIGTIRGLEATTLKLELYLKDLLSKVRQADNI